MATIVRAAWAIVLAQYSETRDVAFGTSLIGRNAPVRGITRMVGPTLATVPIRIDLETSESVGDLLNAVHTQTIDMIPFEHSGLQNIKKLGHDCQQACDFRNLLVVQPPQISNERIGFFGPQEMMDVATLAFHTYPLVLSCSVGESSVDFHFSFDANVISAKSVEMLCHHLHHTIDQLCTLSPSTKLDEVSLYGNSDEAQIAEWNQQPPIEQNVLIHEEIGKQFIAHPDAEAVFGWDRSLSYKELDHLSSQLAHYLRTKCCTGPDVLIPLLFQKSSWVPVAMLAVLKSGSGFVSLDASHPPERLQEIIEQCNPPVVLISPETAYLKNRAPATLEVSQSFFDASSDTRDAFFESNHVSLDTSGSASSVENHSSPRSETSTSDSSFSFINGEPPSSETSAPEEQSQTGSNNIAYVIFTSGSTGKPKGVMIEHRQFCSGVIGPRQEALLRSTESRVLQFASLSFDTSLEDILTTLLFGGCVCIPSENDRVNDISAFINRSRANTAHITPSFASTLSPTRIPTMKFFRLGGERLTPALVQTWANVLDLRNVYGPTETSITATCGGTVTPNSDAANIGKGVAAHIWITNPDNHDQLTPVGLVGEMLVEGPLLARGYLGDTEKTDKVFIKNPLWARNQSGSSKMVRRFYKTGDLCRYEEDGSIIYIGRKDTQVKIYGQRIELGEVEDHLEKALHGPYEVAVEAMLLPGEGSHKALVAFICLGDAFDGDDQDLQKVSSKTMESLQLATKGLDATLARTLPKFMIPSRYIPLRAIPTTISKKIDRKKLQAMLSALTSEQLQVFSAMNGMKTQPETDMELRIQNLVASMLNLRPEQVGMEDNFLRLGGDSIMAIKLASALRERGIDMTVSSIFNNSTLGDMAQQAQTLEGNSTKEVAADIEPFQLLDNDATLADIFEHLSKQGIEKHHIQDVYPCTPLQEGLLSLSTREGMTYVSRSIFKLPENIDLDRFRAAWTKVIAANDILRTRMVNLNAEGTLQVVLQDNSPWQEQQDLETYLNDSMNNFDPEGELIQCALCTSKEKGSTRPIFVLTMHHALYDGWCYPQILSQVDEAYNGAPTESLSRPRFANFIGYLQNMSEASLSEFWLTKLDGCTDTCDFPLQKSSAHPKRQMATTTAQIPFSLFEDALATVSTLIRAAWALVISHYADSSDVIFGLSLTGRNADVPGIDSMIGPTLATIPFRLRLNRDMTIAELLGYLVRDMVETIPFEHAGLQNIQHLHPDIKRVCEFNSLVVVQAPEDGSSTNSLFAESLQHDSIHEIDHPYPIVLECHPQNGVIQIDARFDTGTISEKQMQRVLGTLGQVIGELCANPTKRIADISPTSQSDLREIQSWNRSIPPTIYGSAKDSIEDSLRRTPQAQALYSTGRSLSYAELDSLTACLARHLIESGICQGVFVPLIFEKSIWHTVSMLSVIRAGGTFVSLDPANLPAQRCVDIIEQCQATIILTSAQAASNLPDIIGVAKVYVSDSFLARLENSGALPTGAEVSPESVLYTSFTSGTTGRPKGVMISHKAFRSVFETKADRFGIDACTRLLQFASHSFDVSIDDILITILKGGCVCIPSEEARFGGLEDFIDEANVNFANITPSAASTLNSLRVAKNLKMLRFAGEKVTSAHLEKWTHCDVDLKNFYGPTEASNVCASTSALRPDCEKPSNIGRGLGALLWVVDKNDHEKLVPIGAIGELCIQGPGLAKGYLNNFERTNAVFVDAPSWARISLPTDADCRLYKTGDLVRYEDDGTITYLSRKDSQVKFHGLRIELDEIEHHLRQIETLREAQILVDVVQPVDKPDSEILTCFVSKTTFHGDYYNLLQLISDRLSLHIPRYMIPTAILPLERLPLLTSGKVDRKKMLEIGKQTPLEGFYVAESSKKYIPPQTTMEWEMQELWAKTLNIEAAGIGKGDNFFGLGADSITVMRLVAAARSHKIHIKAKDVFTAQTLESIAGLAVPMDEKPQLAQQTTRIDLSPGSKAMIQETLQINPELVEKVVEGSDFQAWCLRQTSLDSVGWRIYFTYKFDQGLDPARLKRAWHALIERHESLRSRFVFYQGKLLQAMIKFRPQDYPIIPTQLEQATGQQLCNANRQLRSINGPPIRLYFNEAKREMTLEISHAVYDGLSLPRIHQDLSQLYDGQDLAPTPQYSQYSAIIQTSSSAQTEAYWRQFFHNSTMTSIVGHVTPSSRNPQNSSVARTIPKLSPTPKHITPATILKTAWALVLSRIHQTPDVIFGSLVQNRNIDLPGVEDIVGACLNFLPVRAQIAPESTTISLLHQIQNQHIESVPHAGLGFQHMITHCTDWPNWTRFSSIVQYQNLDQSIDELSIGGSACKIEAFVPDADSADIWVLATPRGDGQLDVTLEFCGSIVSSAFATALVEELCSNMRVLAKSAPNAAIPDLGMPLRHQPKLPIRVSGSRAAAVVKGGFDTESFSEAEKNGLRIVQETWERVIGRSDGSYLNTPFWDICGDLVAASQLSALYSTAGMHVSVESLIEHPSMAQQAKLLAAYF